KFRRNGKRRFTTLAGSGPIIHLKMLIKLSNYKFPLQKGNRYIRIMTDTLVLLHVIFRHGDRTPERNAIYPTDPHKDYDYSLFGYGQLTNEGKKRAYRFGQSLRRQYGHFLNDIYKTEELDAWTSDFDRTKMTLQLVLAALYPPTREQVWFDGIPWQPIPYNCIPRNDDKMFLRFFYDKVAVDEYNKRFDEMYTNGLNHYSDVVEYVEKHSGMKIENPRVMFSLACTLAAEEKIGLKLPEWTQEVWPHKIEEYALQEFHVSSSTKRLQSLTIGRLLQKIVEDSVSKTKNASSARLHLYSGHDFTVGMILKALNVFDWRHPDFCANVTIELHNIDGVYGFKVKYQISENEEAKLLEFPNIGSFWPLDEFMEEYRDILGDDPYN
ncbi:Phosphatase, partial [Oryctes borbonicus]